MKSKVLKISVYDDVKIREGTMSFSGHPKINHIFNLYVNFWALKESITWTPGMARAPSFSTATCGNYPWQFT
jgi:hypothetical protein